MTTLKIYEMKTEKKDEKQVKPVLVDKLPDESNLAVVNGVLCIVDAHNKTVVSIETVLKELNKLSDMMFVRNGSSCDTVYAIYNLFDQLKEEFENGN